TTTLAGIAVWLSAAALMVAVEVLAGEAAVKSAVALPETNCVPTEESDPSAGVVLVKMVVAVAGNVGRLVRLLDAVGVSVPPLFARPNMSAVRVDVPFAQTAV